MSFAKRLTAIFLTVVLSIGIFGTVKASALSYNDRSAAMIQFFSNTEIDTTPNEEDIRVLGVYLSNFYTPFVTNYRDIKDTLEDAIAYLMGGEVPAGSEATVTTLVNYILTNMSKQRQQLYMRTTGLYELASSEITSTEATTKTVEASLRRVYMEGGYKGTKAYDDGVTIGDGDTVGPVSGRRATNIELYWTDADGEHVVFNAAVINIKGTLYWVTDEKYACGAAMMMGLSRLVEQADSLGQISEDLMVSILEDSLYVTPFGDIITNAGIVVLPGCLNPYLWSKDGNTIPLINSFVTNALRDGPSMEATSTIASALNAGNYSRSGCPFSIFGVQTPTTASTALPHMLNDASVSERDTYILWFSIGENDAVSFSLSNNDYTNRDREVKFSNNEDTYSYIAMSFDPQKYYDALNNVIGPQVTESLMGGLHSSFVPVTGDPAVNAMADRQERISFLQQFFLFENGEYPQTVDTEEAKQYSFSYFFKSENVNDSIKVSVPEGCTSKKYTNTQALDAENIYGSAGEQFTAKVAQALFTQFGWSASTILDVIGTMQKPQNNHTVKIDYSIISTHSGIATALQATKTGALYPQLFYTYMLTEMNRDAFPPVVVDSSGLLASMMAGSQNKELEELQEEVLKNIVDLTRPGVRKSKGNFITDFINSWVLDAHRKMLGITSTDIATVSNSGMLYSGFTGHVTTPTLQDLPFTKNIVDNYNNVYIVLLAVVIVGLAIMFIVKMRSWKSVIAMLIIMAVVLALPQGVVDGTITLSNTVSNSMYADRFTYWALIQHQQTIQNLRDAEKSGDTTSKTLAQNLAMVTNYYSGDSIRLKWMSPKKEKLEPLYGVTPEGEETLIPGATIFKFLFSGYFKQESYSSDPLATYVYRTYYSLSESAKQLYGETVASQAGMTGGYLAPNSGILFDSSLTADVANGNVPKQLMATMDGIPTLPYTAHRPTFQTDKFRGLIFLDPYIADSISNRDITPGRTDFGLDLDDLTDSNADALESGLGFALYSESPFYYFYNALGLATTTDGHDAAGVEVSEGKYSIKDGSYLTKFLSESAYKVTDKTSPYYGLTKDFLDLEGLFTYVVPVLYSMNGVVIDFTELRGTDYQKYAGDTSLNSMEELTRIWNMYSPWVDAMYSTNYAKDSIRVLEQKVQIDDALNPAFYHDANNGRLMAFGEADMKVKGVTLGDVSQVEYKIYKVLEDTYIDLRYLANYASFSDEALLTAAAMAATFNFNEQFSESNVFGESITLYPQGYELKTFSYDAFLRMILLNSTGQSVNATTDVYTAVVENTSFWTGLLLLIVDALALYVLPTAKLVFIILVFFLSVLMLMSCFLQGIENAPKVLIQSIVIPMLKFLAITVLHAFATALLMGEGLTELVGSKSGAIITNDPTVTLLLLILINGLVSIFLIKIIIALIKSGIEWLKSTVEAVKGLLKALADKVAGGVKKVAVTGAALSGGALGASAAMDSARSGNGPATLGKAKLHKDVNNGAMSRDWKKRMNKFTNNLEHMQDKSSEVETKKGPTKGGQTKKPNVFKRAGNKIANSAVAKKASKGFKSIKQKGGKALNKLSNNAVVRGVRNTATGMRIVAGKTAKGAVHAVGKKIKGVATGAAVLAGNVKTKVVNSKAVRGIANSAVYRGAKANTKKLKAKASTAFAKARNNVVTAGNTIAEGAAIKATGARIAVESAALKTKRAITNNKFARIGALANKDEKMAEVRSQDRARAKKLKAGSEIVDKAKAEFKKKHSDGWKQQKAEFAKSVDNAHSDLLRNLDIDKRKEVNTKLKKLGAEIVHAQGEAKAQMIKQYQDYVRSVADVSDKDMQRFMKDITSAVSKQERATKAHTAKLKQNSQKTFHDMQVSTQSRQATMQNMQALNRTLATGNKGKVRRGSKPKRFKK